MRALALTFAASLAGVGVFSAANLPLPWLLGPLFACLLTGLAGGKMRGAPRIAAVMRTVLGVAIGATITPDLIHRIGGMAGSVALIPVFLALVGLVGYPFFRRVWGFDPATSWYGSMPGGLQDMLIFGEAAGADVRALSLLQATRVLVIVAVLPLVLQYGMGLDLGQPLGAPVSAVPGKELLIMAALAAVGWALGAALRLPGASILGPMFLTAAASLSGYLHHRPPAEAILAAQFFIGIAIGVKYVGVTVAELRRVVTAAVCYTLLLFCLTAMFAAVVTTLSIAPVLEAVLAFAPGGQAEMALLALVTGADVAFVVTHHMARLIVVITCAPLVKRFF